MRFAFRSIFLLLALACTGAQAQLSIEITGGGANQIPLGVLRFAGEEALAQRISDIVEADLQRSGRFRMLFAGNVDPLPAEVAQVNFGDWKNRNADAFTLSAQQVRTTAHRIADVVYEKLTGDRGVFSTRIAYVVKQGSRYELQIADADGGGAQTALGS